MNKLKYSIINRIKKDKKLLLIMLLGFLGMILLLVSGFFAGDKSEASDGKNDTASLQRQIEKDLTELLKSVDGVGKVKVMVTLDCLEERIIAQDNETVNENGAYETKNEYVLVEKSNDKEGLILKTITPVIRGVGISCEGAVSNTMKQEITKLVCSALGIAENKVWVSKMQE